MNKLRDTYFSTLSLYCDFFDLDFDYTRIFMYLTIDIELSPVFAHTVTVLVLYKVSKEIEIPDAPKGWNLLEK